MKKAVLIFLLLSLVCIEAYPQRTDKNLGYIYKVNKGSRLYIHMSTLMGVGVGYVVAVRKFEFDFSGGFVSPNFLFPPYKNTHAGLLYKTTFNMSNRVHVSAGWYLGFVYFDEISYYGPINSAIVSLGTILDKKRKRIAFDFGSALTLEKDIYQEKKQDVSKGFAPIMSQTIKRSYTFLYVFLLLKYDLK